MQQTVYGKGKRLLSPFIRKILLPMKLTVLFLFFFSFGALASAQSVTLSLHDAPLARFISAVESQTSFRFVYVSDQLDISRPVTVQAVNTPLKEVLDICFAQQPLDYVIEDRMIIIRQKAVTEKPQSVYELRGVVTNQDKEPLPGVSIQLKHSNRTVTTNESGAFILEGIESNSVLIVSGAEIETMEVPVAGRTFLSIVVKARLSSLDQVIVMAYGETTQRLNTGNITKVTAAEIERQPVSNPLAALQGRVPGMVVTQTSGVPGSAFKVEIRGRSSLDMSLSRNDPLIIIDGVPFEPGNMATNQLISAANQPFNTSDGGLSPLNTINPSDIESIEVLKDADATAIYGSRGANGVILITTKRAKTEKLQVNAGFYYGSNNPTRLPKMMNKSEYIAMRKEAFKNDGRAMTTSTAPDLIRWDTTHYTDFSKFVNNTAHSSDAQISLSAAGSQTSFMLNGGFHKETSVFAKDLDDERISLRLSLSHHSVNKRFKMSFGGYYVSDDNKMIQNDLTQYLPIPPHFQLYDSLGNPNFRMSGSSITSVTNFASTPAADLLKKYRSVNNHTAANIQMSYELLKGLLVSLNGGYNSFISNEQQINPRASISPLFRPNPFSRFANGKNTSWIFEPQLKYAKKIDKHALNLLTGATLQQRTGSSEQLTASGFPSDLLLYSRAAATSYTANNSFSQYKYLAVFSRLTYNFNDRYLLNLSIRRDGSSKFGPGKQFANFGAVAGAWIFTEEPLFRNKIKWLSYGKLRSSYGSSGNDQIGDYRYLDLWNIEIYPYESVTGLSPSTLYNPDFHWEVTRKWELAIETGFLDDRILTTVAFYRNRSGNQLIHYQLPFQTGFQSVVANLPALVENRGWEYTLFTRNIDNRNFKWTSSLNVSFPRNRLISFPGLANSSYASVFKEGHSLSSYWGFHSLGVNRETGIYEFTDENKDGVITPDGDYTIKQSPDPRFYGGFQNTFRYRNWLLDILFEGKRQIGINFIGALQNINPGQPVNLPVFLDSRWQNPGDISDVQRYTTTYASDAADAGANFRSSNGIYSDASFVRLKNISLSFILDNPNIFHFRIKQLKIFCNAQNLFVVTPLKGLDPETQRYYTLPPMRVISGGIQISI